MTLLTAAFNYGLLAARPAAAASNKGYYYCASDVTGGTLYQSDGSTWHQLAAGVSAAGTLSPLTTKGDVWGYAATDDRIPIGADATVLTADSGQALGLKWAAPTPLTTKGDLLGYSTLAARIPVGADATVLTADSGQALGLKWAAPTSGGTPLDGWVDDTAETWTYASATTFTVAGDQTAKYTVGTFLKLTQAATVKYFAVSAAPVFGGGNTTVTITGGTDYTLANSAISANYHSYAANPQGYPGWFNYTPTWTASVSNPALGNGTLAARFCVLGRRCLMTFRLTMGNTTTFGSGTYNLTLPIAYASDHPGGAGRAYDSSAVSPTNMGFNVEGGNKIAGYYGTNATWWAPGSPFTWATSDQLNGSIDYAI